MEDLERKICEFLRIQFPDDLGLKTDEFIKKYCRHYETIYEEVCNNGFDVDEVIKNIISHL